MANITTNQTKTCIGNVEITLKFFGRILTKLSENKIFCVTN